MNRRGFLKRALATIAIALTQPLGLLAAKEPSLAETYRYTDHFQHAWIDTRTITTPYMDYEAITKAVIYNKPISYGCVTPYTVHYVDFKTFNRMYT